ncbi:MAG: cupin domain-containing protein [Deltaproteobacteria bacterium]|nr:cupin domain-containing protein [Deltaproteobacteria bacterium]MBW2047461.1 cupin domain-containing protein [Deltaproteobacteria bacterium]MBW2110793.1 cupin domain-containing protein [Deltaproteobacteria bacterium]HDZ90742.1 cupin domain-containing protein [Deltaproteobacteria bacterium]
MDILNVKDKDETKIETFPYRGKPLKVNGVGVRWLSQAGLGDSPEYGLRFFTVGPGGEIPIHNHFYVQTMFILSGNMTVYSYHPETDEQTAETQVGPNDAIFIPSMEPHSMKNNSNTEEATFLCCIANVYEEDE